MEKNQSKEESCSNGVRAGGSEFSAVDSTDKAEQTKNMYSIPAHLPAKMAICSFQWAWFTLSGPTEPYYDLEEVMIGLKERNYNAVRIDTALNWCFHKDGSHRGEVAIRAVMPGYSHRFRVNTHHGGISVDVLSRLFQFMELAKKYDIFVILSDWEYMHTTWLVESVELRNEVLSIPVNERLIHMARHMDRLVTMLKEKGLAGNIAFIEPHNEADIGDLPRGDENFQLHTEAVAYLRDRHPDILVSADLAIMKNIGTTDNSQVYDHHLYVGQAIYEDYPDELEDLFEPDVIPYSVFIEKFPFSTENRLFNQQRWLRIKWLYYNINIDKFDRWMTGNYKRLENDLKSTAKDYYSRHSQEAKRRGIPMVVSEGGFHNSPLYSRFEESESALEYYDYLTDLAIEHDVWGFVFSTYNGPEIPVWWACQRWVTETNDRFLKGTVKTSYRSMKEG